MSFCVIFLGLLLVLSCSGNKGADVSGTGVSPTQTSVLSPADSGFIQTQTQKEDETQVGNPQPGDSGKKDEAKVVEDEAAYRLITE